jgi:hypothetical protein
MNINLKIKLPEPPKTKPSASPSARLPGEKAPFKEMKSTSIRNLVPQQNWEPAHGGIDPYRPVSIDAKFQAFLAGEVHQRKELKQTLEGLIWQQQYINRFLLNCMSAE